MARVILVRHGRTTANTSGVLAGRTDAELDDHGRKQAETLAADLAEVSLLAAITSPMLRTRQTLDLLLPQPITPVHHDHDLAEVDYGEWTGKSLKELGSHPLWKVVQQHPAAVTFPGGESMAQMSARSVAAVRRWSAWADAEVADATLETDTTRDTHPASWTPAHPGAPEMAAPGPQDAVAEPTSPSASAEAPAEPPVTAQETPPAPPIPTFLVVSHGDIIKAIVADALGMHLDAFQRICIDPCSVSVVHYTEARTFVECVNTNGSVLRSWRNLAHPPTQAVPGGGAGR